MKLNKKLLSLFAILIIASMIVASCGTPAAEAPAAEAPAAEAPAAEAPAAEAPAAEAPAAEAPAAEAMEPKEIVVVGGAESYHLKGWSIETDDAFQMSYYGLLETLIKIDYEGNMVPSLATSWTMVDDNTWQFDLRQGVSFSNGEPFNAEAVVKALNYITSSPTPPRGITAETFASVEAADEYTVIIKTATVDALLPNRLSSPNTGILAPSAYINETGPVDAFNTGTGPFILTEEVPDQSVTLVKNPNYWGGEVKLDKVTFMYIPDPQIRAGMLQTGEADIAIHPAVEQLPILEADPNIVISKSQTPRTTTLDLNTTKAPLDNVLVRKAIAYAIDKDSLAMAALEGNGTGAVGPMAMAEVWNNPDLVGFPYDPDKAKELLAEAGYAEGELTIGLWTYPSRSELPVAAMAIQNMLGKVGINVEIRLAAYGALEPDVLGGNYDMFIVSRNHVLDNYDVEGFLSADYGCEGGYNRSQFCDPAMDAKLVEARTLVDPEARYTIYRDIQTLLVDEQCVSVFLYHPDIVDGMSAKVLNFQIHPLERYIMTADMDLAQ